jgi:hypothetical protein
MRGASSHARKRFVVTDAYYVPAKTKSILQWPFVTRKHVNMAKSAQLATTFALTEDHLEAIHFKMHHVWPTAYPRRSVMPEMGSERTQSASSCLPHTNMCQNGQNASCLIHSITKRVSHA